MTWRLLHLVELSASGIQEDSAEECCATSGYLRGLQRIVICELDLYSADNTALKSAWHSSAYIKAKLLLACPS